MRRVVEAEGKSTSRKLFGDGRKRKHLNVLSLRRRNETWLWQNAIAFATKP